MSYFIGRNRKARQTYGFDEVALGVPSENGKKHTLRVSLYLRCQE